MIHFLLFSLFILALFAAVLALGLLVWKLRGGSRYSPPANDSRLSSDSGACISIGGIS